MQLTFLGHQSWLLSHGTTNVLVDPLLVNSFGNCQAVEFFVYPPRRVDLAKMPKIDAVILSHEHLDHFHIPSLDQLSRDTPFFVSNLMLSCVCDAIEKLGFKVHRVRPFKKFVLGVFGCVFYPAAPETVFWEKRVHQIYLYPTEDQSRAVFIAVDALINKDFKSALNSGKVPMRAIICANNSQVVPEGAQGAHSNLLPIPDADTLRNPGIAILYELVDRYLKGMPPVRDIIFCGNGFCDRNQEFGAFLYSDNHRLAEIATELGLHERVYGPRPGDALVIDTNDTHQTQVDWIKLDKAEHESLLKKQADFIKEPVYPPFRPLLGDFKNEADLLDAVSLVESELKDLSRALMLSPVGQLSLSVHEHLAGELESRRILFRFVIEQGNNLQYAFDVNEVQFFKDDTPTDQILEKFPFGIEMHLIDFAGVLQGKLQVWDLAGTAMRSWYVGNRYNNLVSFLYGRYGEQARPDLAAKVYNGAIARLPRHQHAAV